MRSLITVMVAAVLVGASGYGVRLISDTRADGLRNGGAVRGKGGHLTAEDTIQDLLDHPAFAGFGRLLLPWDDRTENGGLRLRDVGSLLPYHTHVDPETVVGALNHMVDEVNNGRTIFYDFYTAEEKQADRTKANTGLFFFRGVTNDEGQQTWESVGRHDLNTNGRPS